MRPKGMRNAALLTGMVFLLAQTGRIPAVSAEKNAHMEQGKEQAAEADPARVETEQPAEEELSMEEAVAVMEEPPAEEAVPTAEEAPVEEAVPVMEEPLAGEAAPAAEELSMDACEEDGSLVLDAGEVLLDVGCALLDAGAVLLEDSCLLLDDCGAVPSQPL